MKIAMWWRELTIGGSYKNFGEGDIFPGGEMNKILAGEGDAPKAPTPTPSTPSCETLECGVISRASGTG